MSERCPHSPLQTTGWLEGWRLTFGGEEHGWDGALTTIVQDPFEQVFVAVYDVTPEDETALDGWEAARSEEHTSELQSLMRISYAVFCLKKKKTTYTEQVIDIQAQ